MTLTCKNCHQHFKGHYCNHCGQSAETYDINLHYVLHDIQHGIFHFDKGILYTTKQLFTRPGHAIREFIEGKRVRHFKPIAFVFILSTLYAVLSHYLKVNTFLDDVSIGITDARSDSGKGFAAFMQQSLKWLQSHYALSALIFLPFFSLASYWAFRKTGFNYFKHLVLNAYLTGQRTIVNLFFLLFLSFAREKSTISTIQDTQFFVGVALTFWTYMQFFNKNSVVKNILLTILTYVLLIVIVVLAVVLIGIVEGVVNR